MGKAINVTDQNFEQVVLQSDKPVLVDFWATWCGPCIMMAPVIDELAEEYQSDAIIAKLDVDANPQTAAKYGIRSIPTLMYFKGGEVVDKVVGASRKGDLAGKLESQLA